MPGGGGIMPGGGGADGMAPGGADTTEDGKKKPKGGHKRTEFIVVFIWKEPRPSDEFMPKEPEAAPASGGMTMGTGMSSGSMQPK